MTTLPGLGDIGEPEPPKPLRQVPTPSLRHELWQLRQLPGEWQNDPAVKGRMVALLAELAWREEAK